MGGYQITKKNIVKLAVIITIALAALLYGSGYIGQFLYNYDAWQAAGGAFGTSPELPNANFFTCIAAAFRWPTGLYGLGICVGALAILLFMVMRMGYSDTGEYDQDRNLIYSDKGTYGTAGFISPVEHVAKLLLSKPSTFSDGFLIKALCHHILLNPNRNTGSHIHTSIHSKFLGMNLLYTKFN